MENMKRTISITLNAKYPVSYSGKVDVIIQDLNSGETRTIEVPMENLYTVSGKNERVADKIKEAEHLASAERRRRKENPQFAGYADDTIKSFNWKDRV